jgi:hypothetical protein
MKKLQVLILATTLGLAGTAEANLLEKTVIVSDTDPGSVQYVNFFVDQSGIFDIRAQGADTLGAGYNPDPQIYLFDAPLSGDHFLVSDDDGGIGYDSLLAGVSLSLGHYVLAVSQSVLDLDEAVSGLNAGSVFGPGKIKVSIYSADGTALPEPTSLTLVAAGAAAFAAARRKAAQDHGLPVSET